MRVALDAIKSDGQDIKPGRGNARELVGVLLELTDPRARLSRSETRGKPFSALGELCWYLSGSEALDFIKYYIDAYKHEAADGILRGAYGPRLFRFRDFDQVAGILSNLRDRRDSRQAVIQLFDAQDLRDDINDVPCTCVLQFFSRNGTLSMVTYMRSNDAYLGLPHDIFCFTMIQEMLATTLGMQLGSYKHAVGSLHLYDRDFAKAEAFRAEGWQSRTSMPAMPSGDAFGAAQELVRVEKLIRSEPGFPTERVARMDPYWADLARLLAIHRASKDGDKVAISEMKAQMTDREFDVFIDARISRML